MALGRDPALPAEAFLQPVSPRPGKGRGGAGSSLLFLFRFRPPDEVFQVAHRKGPLGGPFRQGLAEFFGGSQKGPEVAFGEAFFPKMGLQGG